MDDFMEIDEEFAEFTLAEVKEMTNVSKNFKENPLSQELCEELATKFSCSAHRTGKSSIKWEQVQTWFLDKEKEETDNNKKKSVVPQVPSATKAKPKPKKKFSAPVLPKKNNFSGYMRLPDIAYERSQRPRVSAAKMAAELKGLVYEAMSAKDLAWYDVAAFLNFRVLYTGKLEVRVRFAGFTNEEDEWVDIRKVRERSTPLEPSECGRVNAGDNLMCFREDEYLAVYADARVVEIQRSIHDNTKCTCVFVVCYDLDNEEEKVSLDKLCCRPNRRDNEVHPNS